MIHKLRQKLLYKKKKWVKTCNKKYRKKSIMWQMIIILKQISYKNQKI